MKREDLHIGARVKCIADCQYWQCLGEIVHLEDSPVSHDGIRIHVSFPGIVKVIKFGKLNSLELIQEIKNPDQCCSDCNTPAPVPSLFCNKRNIAAMRIEDLKVNARVKCVYNGPDYGRTGSVVEFTFSHFIYDPKEEGVRVQVLFDGTFNVSTFGKLSSLVLHYDILIPDQYCIACNTPAPHVNPNAPENKYMCAFCSVIKEIFQQ